MHFWARIVAVILNSTNSIANNDRMGHRTGSGLQTHSRASSEIGKRVMMEKPFPQILQDGEMKNCEQCLPINGRNRYSDFISSLSSHADTV